MKVHYTFRKAEVSDEQKDKLKPKFEKIHKILNPRNSLEAHVIITQQRRLCEAEVTLHALHHTLVVTAANTEAFPALAAAVDKLEKQAVKNKHKLIDARRNERHRQERPVPETAPEPDNGAANPAGPRIVRSRRVEPKPLTTQEAMIQLDELNLDQVTFRDAEDGEIKVLLRRRDGNFELVEAEG